MKCWAQLAHGHRSVVALAPMRGLFLCVKYLFIAAILAGVRPVRAGSAEPSGLVAKTSRHDRSYRRTCWRAAADGCERLVNRSARYASPAREFTKLGSTRANRLNAARPSGVLK